MKKIAYSLLAAAALLSTPALANEEYQYNVPGRFFQENYDGTVGYEKQPAVIFNESRSVMHSSDIMRTQRALRNRGYAVGTIDGVVGPETRGALVRFQRDNMLPANGQLTNATLQALGVQDVKPEYYSSLHPFNY